MKPGWLLAVPALLMVAAAAIAFAQNPPASHNSSQIIQFLNQTIDWYRHVTAVQQTATEPDDFILVSDNGRMANQVVRLAFDFARAEAQDIAKQGTSAADHNQDQKQSTGSPALLQLEGELDKQTQDDQTEVESLRQKLETATGKKRQQLQSQLAETEAELDLAKARRDQVHSMAEFLNQASGTGLGATGLQAQIQALADSVPAASAPTNNSDESSAKEQISPALIAAAANKPAPSGIWDLTADLLALSQKIRTVDGAVEQTKALAARSREIRTPLVSRLRDLSARAMN